MNMMKYPKTLHLPWSEKITRDDKIITSLESFYGKRIIITEKMDGENTTLYNNYTFARSIDSESHITRDWIKNFWATFSYKIPPGWRICGENLYAKHTIYYENLESYFLGFSIWDNKNICIDWDETLRFFKIFGIIHVPILYDGLYNEKNTKDIYKYGSEGYVIRVANSFHYNEFGKNVAKFVKKSFMNEENIEHWKSKEIKKNKLRKG